MDPQQLQVQLTGFLNKQAQPFVAELWKLLLDAQDSPHGIPRAFVERKKQELVARREASGGDERRGERDRGGFSKRDDGRGDDRDARVEACLAAARDDELWQADVDAAFLNGTMPYELYCHAPRGVDAPIGADGRRQCLRVVGNIYGHPKAPLIYGDVAHGHTMAFAASRFAN